MQLQDASYFIPIEVVCRRLTIVVFFILLAYSNASFGPESFGHHFSNASFGFWKIMREASHQQVNVMSEVVRHYSLIFRFLLMWTKVIIGYLRIDWCRSDSLCIFLMNGLELMFPKLRDNTLSFRNDLVFVKDSPEAVGIHFSHCRSCTRSHIRHGWWGKSWNFLTLRCHKLMECAR